MNAPLRKVGIVTLVLFGLLFANLNWVQAYKANNYRNSRYNARVQLSAYSVQRGSILDYNGSVLAKSVATKDTLKYLRQYPSGKAFQPVLGYRPVNLGATGIERAEDGFLSGSVSSNQLADIFSSSQSNGGNVYLTLQKSVQQVAYNDLANNGGASVGAAVAIDPKTGAILALASSPGFNANPLADHSTASALSAYDKLNKMDPNPLDDRAISQTFPPGSTFKVIISALALQNGLTPDSIVKAGPSYQPLPGSGYTMKNDAPSVCPEAEITLTEALTVSCNTAYAQLGVGFGASAIIKEAQTFGFGDSSLTLAGDGNSAIKVAASQTGTMAGSSGKPDPNYVAQSSIGQFDVRMTTLQGAMIASSIANNGAQMRPYLVAKMQDSALRTTYLAQPETLRTTVTPAVAGQLRTMMDSVVQNGTGTSAKITGYEIGGKTGTADNSVGGLAHRWFIGYAMKDGQPIAAVAVLLVNGGQEGIKSAPKIAGDILNAAIKATPEGQ